MIVCHNLLNPRDADMGESDVDFSNICYLLKNIRTTCHYLLYTPCSRAWGAFLLCAHFSVMCAAKRELQAIYLCGWCSLTTISSTLNARN